MGEGEASRRVLITGISGQLAGLLARSLEQDDRVTYLVGLDNREPRHDLERTEFVRLDITNPRLARIIAATDVDTVVHLSTLSTPRQAGGRARMKEHNVIGAMQLFGALQKAPQVRKLVVKSTTAVYGSEHDAPALLRETDRPSSPLTDGFALDASEVEGYLAAFHRRRPDITTTVLRFANFLGGHLDSVMSSYFTLPAVPTVLGYDPRLQFCHEEDAVEVLRRSVLEDHAGTFNVAGEGVLYLSQCIRLAGRVPAHVPMPLARAVSAAVRRSRRLDFTPEQLRFLQYGRASDITALQRDFGFQPRYTSRQTFEDFVGRRRISGLIDRAEVARWERELYDFISRKGQERFVATRRGM